MAKLKVRSSDPVDLEAFGLELLALIAGELGDPTSTRGNRAVYDIGGAEVAIAGAGLRFRPQRVEGERIEIPTDGEVRRVVVTEADGDRLTFSLRLSVEAAQAARATPEGDDDQALLASLMDGRDVLRFGNGDDFGDAGAGADRLFGRGGNDSLRGGDGRDLLNGGTGDDTLEGGEGRDRLFGKGGSDLLRGEGGDDKLFGGAGEDTLEGGEGNDRLNGGGADDSFVWVGSDLGDDVILGFAAGADRVVVDGSDPAAAVTVGGVAITGFDDLIRDVDANGDVTLAWDGTSITFRGVSDAVFEAGDVLIVL